MGVDGFWPIVSSKGKRVTLDILSDKVVAVDASIWIYQFAHALRASGGDPIRSSHIVGFFKRICKLLYLRIKPVFVFDGPPIPLKFAALRKRHDDTVPDAMFRRAARQILLQNLKQLQVDPSVMLNKPRPILRPPSADDSDSIDEIYVVTDSSDDGEFSPSRRLRLSVPEEFRGFMSERRTLDSVSLPVSTTPARPHHREIKEVEVDARIDEEALKDLPLHEQYRGLLETRSALLSQGRRRALNLATKMGSAADFADLDQLSKDQIKAVVDLAKVTDMSKAVRMQMSRDENKTEVYVPGSSSISPPSVAPGPAQPKKRRKKNNDQYYLESSFTDNHSVLRTARTVSREQLLFDKIEKDTKSPEKVKQETVDDSEPSEDEKDPKMLLSNLFGDEWSDIIGKSEKPTVSSIEVVKRVRVPEPLIQNIEFVMEPLNVPQRHVEEIPIPTEEPSPESSYEDSSYSEEESVYIESESEEALVAPVFVEDPHVVQKTFEPVIYPVEAEPGNGSIPPEEAAVADITDAELSLFAELADPFPAFQDDVEEEIFDNRVRERIDVLESLGDTYEEIQQLLTAFGIPWVSAPADAEAQCAFLAASGLTDGVISDDSDTIVYGSPIVFRHLYIGDSTVEIYRTQEIGFDREELISLALLLGCDFTIGVRGIGPVNATEIVRHYKGVDQLRRFREWAERFAGDSGKESEPVIGEDPDDASLRVFKSTHANYRSQWLFTDDFPSQEVWDVFDKPLVDTNLEPFTWATPDEQLISEVVTSFTDLKQSQVDHILSSTMSQYRQASTQRRITDYFSPAFERGSVAEVVSKRLKAALAQSTSF